MTTSMTKPSVSQAPRSKRRVGIIVCAGVVAAALVAWALVQLIGGGEPRLNENSVVLTKFIHSAAFERLAYEKQRQFYKVLDDRKDEVDQLFKDQRLTEPEYRSALEAAWLGKHINRVEKYFALPPGKARDDYIDKLLDKKERKDGDASHQPGKIKTDETAAEMKVESWPPAAREQWKTFHVIYSKEKKARETAATKPNTIKK